MLCPSLISEARAILDTDKIKELTKTVTCVDTYLRCVNALKCAANLAHHGLLGSMDRLWLYDFDLSPVPSQHLTSLASSVTRCLSIGNVSGCDLVSILNIIKFYDLHIHRQTLGREETQALVQAMESRVVRVMLVDAVTMDIDALAEYSGQGVCKSIVLCQYTVDTCKEELMTWARRRNWSVVTHRGDYYCLPTMKEPKK